MKALQIVLDKSWKINLLLFICSFSIYAYYFHPVLLNINSILSSITGDALKNYYTYSYHIKNDESILHFSGMNFPFGEHVVFTDCQPILTFILRLFPFTHNYLIGILHTLLFASYIVTPLLLNKIFVRFELDKFSSFFISLAITLLSPQFAKINGGHHALAYGCAIPYSILLILNFVRENSTGNLVKLLIYNLLMFFLHPYMGFSTSLFTFLAILFCSLLSGNRNRFIKDGVQSILAGLFPLLAFKVFMKLTDQHPNRTAEPHGNKTLVENIDSLLAPDFGPFKTFLENIFNHKTAHLEGHSYLGFFTILLSFVLLILTPFFIKRIIFKKEMAAVFMSSVVLLFISFGWHIKLLDFFHIQSASLNQFRATCRFAWFFYYTLPLFTIPVLYHLLKNNFQKINTVYLFRIISALFLFVNLLEANFYFKKDEINFWKFRNILNEKFLTQEEKQILQHIKSNKNQAILPLPMFSIGSEMYDRLGADNSMIPAMMYSYHGNIPIASGAMSRSSISETEELISLLNSYKKNNPVMNRISSDPFLVIKTKDDLMPDEDRLLSEVKMFYKNKELEFGEINKSGLVKAKLDNHTLQVNQRMEADSNNLVFISSENRKPFLTSNMKNYENIYILDSNKIKSGRYIVSFHYHYTRKVYTSLDHTLIITKGKGSEYNWQNFQRISLLSGFYPGFAVMEYKVDLEKDSRYEFILNGMHDLDYHISHFMLRAEGTSIITKENKTTLYNNFPD